MLNHKKPLLWYPILHAKKCNVGSSGDPRIHSGIKWFNLLNCCVRRRKNAFPIRIWVKIMSLMDRLVDLGGWQERVWDWDCLALGFCVVLRSFILCTGGKTWYNWPVSLVLFFQFENLAVKSHCCWHLSMPLIGKHVWLQERKQSCKLTVWFQSVCLWQQTSHDFQ